MSDGGGGVSAGGVSRPLDSDDLRLIEEDLSKQLSSEMNDRDLELEAEPYVTSMENRGEMNIVYILLRLFEMTDCNYGCVQIGILLDFFSSSKFIFVMNDIPAWHGVVCNSSVE